MVEIIHTTANNRVRFKVSGLYRSEPLKKHIELSLSKNEGIDRFFASTLTSNVLIYFNSNNNVHIVASFLKTVVEDYKNSVSNHSKRQQIIEKRKQKEDRRQSYSRRELRKLVIHAEDQKTEQWHLKEANAVLDFFGVDKTYGLFYESASENFKKFGPNVLPESVPRSGLSIFVDQIKSVPVLLLGIAAGVSMLTGGIADAIVILGVVAINAAIGYTTESQSEKTIHSLKNLAKPSAIVIRQGHQKEIRTDKVVPGDIIILRPGSYVPADARLIEANNLSIDESVLTGESFPVLKRSETITVDTIDADIPLADRTNMVYMGTLVIGGQGVAVVVATGRFTEIGKIQILVGESKSPETPIEKQLNRIGTQLVLISCSVCGIILIIGLIRGYGIIQMLKTSISLAVAAVPEGLPTVATTTLALGITKMRKYNILIRNLDAVETLGSIQTICLDKTGTITMNKMSVVSIYTGMKRISVSSGSFMIEKEDDKRQFFQIRNLVSPCQFDELLRLIQVSAICNESFVTRQKDMYIVNGSPTENALIYLALNAGVDVMVLREKFPILSIKHRSENRNFMTTIHDIKIAGSQNDLGRIIAVKGSPNEVLSLCGFYMKDGVKKVLTEDELHQIEIENERMAGNALRVLGVAYSFIVETIETGNGNSDLLDSSEDILTSELIWLGLVGMADPIREGVKELIHAFHNAGIETIMITGDQTPTAFAIGKELNLSKDDRLEILDSTNLSNIDADVLSALCKKVHVFARVSPANKLQIVQALQGSGKIVAMTGDGINDGPALKVANIGIAMGHAGTDVAREVADIIIEDDKLETMIIAVSHGRTIFNNIRKSIRFLLSTNLSEIMVMFAAIACGIGQPLTAIQLLWINLVSDIAPGLALALEPPEPDVLSRPPRDPNEPIIRSSDFKRIAFESSMLSIGALIAYGYGIIRYGIGQKANTLAFMGLTLGQILHAISCRSEKHSIFDKEKLPPNKYLNAAIGVSCSLQLLLLIEPRLRSLLGIAPLNVIDGIIIGGSAIVPLLVNESTKKIS